MNMYHVKEDEQAHKLMYKAFELSLSRPTNSQIAKTILSSENCDKAQSENNFYFLNRSRDAVVTFLKKNALEYKKYNDFKKNHKCEFDCDCECYLTEIILPAFKNLTLKFEPYIKYDSLANHILEEFTIEEKERLLSCNLREVLRLSLYKGLAYLAFEHGLYDASCWHHEAAVLMYGGSIVGESLNPSDYVEESEVIARNYRAIGAKGGSQKARNYKEPKQKALSYHDKYLGQKNAKGKYLYSNDKAAREIISYFEKQSADLGYAERSLSNIIGKHRSEQIKV